MYCRKCGTENDDAANFCSKCAENLNQEASASTTPTSVEKTKKKKKSKKKVFGIVIGIVVVLIIIIAIAASEGGERTIDYMGSIRQHRLFRVQGFDATIGTVLNHQILTVRSVKHTKIPHYLMKQ